MRSSRVIRIFLWSWFLAAFLAGHYLLLQRLPAPALQGILIGLTVCLVLVYRVSADFRSWADNLDLRAVALLHVSRFVGIYFLILYRRGDLPYAFAVPGGIGDILVATSALFVALLPMPDTLRLRALSIWNVVGLFDILMVVITAGRLGLTEAGSMRTLTHLPLSLLPTFLVPLIIASHLLIFARIRRKLSAG